VHTTRYTSPVCHVLCMCTAVVLAYVVLELATVVACNSDQSSPES
jgi:hypothetical protein